MSEQIWGVNGFKRQNMQTDHMNTFIISSVLKIKSAITTGHFVSGSMMTNTQG